MTLQQMSACRTCLQQWNSNAFCQILLSGCTYNFCLYSFVLSFSASFFVITTFIADCQVTRRFGSIIIVSIKIQSQSNSINVNRRVIAVWRSLPRLQKVKLYYFAFYLFFIFHYIQLFFTFRSPIWNNSQLQCKGVTDLTVRGVAPSWSN
jgi:hypothetical protein